MRILLLISLLLMSCKVDTPSTSDSNPSSESQFPSSTTIPDCNEQSYRIEFNCLLDLFVKDSSNLYRALDSAGHIFYLAEKKAVFRVNNLAKIVEEISLGAIDEPDAITYSEELDRLYILQKTGEIFVVGDDAELIKFEVNVSPALLFFSDDEPNSIVNIFAMGRFLVVLTDGSVQTVNSRGEHVDFAYLDVPERSIQSWVESTSQLFVTQPHIVGNSIYRVSFNTLTGTIIDNPEDVLGSTDTYLSLLAVSPDGTRAMIDNGRVHEVDRSMLDWISPKIAHAAWGQDNSLLTLEPSNNETFMQRRGLDLRVIDNLVLPGVPRLILPIGQVFYIVTHRDQFNYVSEYTPNADSDSDGVENSVDAFPLDVAASIDRDGDGAPDQWNPGYLAGDSTTGLVLDFFPEYPECWLAIHSDGGSYCNVESGLNPNDLINFTMDDNGILYFMSRSNHDSSAIKIYRWSTEYGQYLPPIQFASLPSDEWLADIVFSSEQNRLYLIYQYRISFLDLSQDTLSEHVLREFERYIYVVDSIGHFLAVTDEYEELLILGKDGREIEQTEQANYAFTQIGQWVSSVNRYYRLEEPAFPSAFVFEEIDPNTGKIKNSGKSGMPEGNYDKSPYIVFSADGRWVISEDGSIYDTEDFQIVKNLPRVISAAALASGENLVVIEESSGSPSRYLLNQYTPDYSEILYSIPLEGAGQIINQNGIVNFVDYSDIDSFDIKQYDPAQGTFIAR